MIKTWEEYLLDNLIYCSDSHSFVHKLFMILKEQDQLPENYDYATDAIQGAAFEATKRLRQDYDIYKKIFEKEDK